MASYGGIPLRSAVIVRHTPNDERASDMATAAGAIPMGGSGQAIDYIARQGRYEEKGGVDRSPTASDRALQSSLDYIARQGRFSEKGRPLQEDATLWDQHGPVSAADLRAEMQAAGGAFIDSIVTVKREHAAQLGLDTKESFQRLMRSCWSESVEKWGLIKDPSDIRWAAAYHTDAANSLHVHVFTWSAAGEIERGATVGRVGTRLGKEVVYREAYPLIRRGRDRREAFLCDLIRHETLRLAGIRDDDRSRRRLEERAEKAGWAERPGMAADLDTRAAARVSGLVDGLRAELALGDGRLARNFRAQAAGRDVARAVQQASPEVSRLAEERDRLIDAHADLKGHDSDSPERRAFVRAEAEDQARRTASAVVRCAADASVRERPMREDLSRLDARSDPGRGNVSFSDKILARCDADTVRVRLPGGGGLAASIPRADTARINGNRATLASLSLEQAYRLTGRDGLARGTATGRELVRWLGPADMGRIARMNPARGEAERHRSNREASAQRLKPAASREGRLASRYGIGPSEARALARDLGTVERAGSGWRADRAARRAAQAIVSSPRVAHELRGQARAASMADGRPEKEHLDRLTSKATERAASQVASRAGVLCAAGRKGSPGDVGRQGPGPSVSIGMVLGSIAEELLSGGQPSAQHRRARQRGEVPREPAADYGRSRTQL